MKEFQNEELFQELDNEVAATCSGGWAILYEHTNFRGRRLRLESSASDLRNFRFNDITSSIQIREGETWAFFRDINYQNLLFTARDGNYSSIPGNDQISSVRRIA